MKITVKVPKKLVSISPETRKRVLGALGAFARDALTRQAQSKLRSTAQTYIRGLTAPGSLEVSEKSATITLVGKMANALEAGSGPFDLKKSLKGKPYRDIPFRHGTPNATIRSSMPQADFNVMQAVVARAKKAAMAGGLSKKGAEAMRVRGPVNMPTPAQPKHKVGLYSSAMHVPGTGNMTFRRMSAKSKGWIHPGFRAASLFPKVVAEVKKLAPRLLADYLRNGI